MYGEFCIAKDLVHPTIVKYKYFMRHFIPEKRMYIFHILMELMEGDDMDIHIKNLKEPISIERVRKIGGQLISGL